MITVKMRKKQTKICEDEEIELVVLYFPVSTQRISKPFYTFVYLCCSNLFRGKSLLVQKKYNP